MIGKSVEKATNIAQKIVGFAYLVDKYSQLPGMCGVSRGNRVCHAQYGHTTSSNRE